MDATPTGFGLALILSAFGFGFRHGFDWDHIAAITDITSSQGSVRTGLRFATLYAGGHAIVVFVIGVLAIVAGETIPDSVDSAMGRVVGVTLVVLGLYVLYALIRYREDFRLRSRWMLIFDGARRAYRYARQRVARDEVWVPVHPGGGVAVEDRDDHGHSHDAFMNYGTGTSLGVGALHGIGAETPTQIVIFLAAAGAGGVSAGIVTLGIFLLGLFAANSILAVASATGFLAATRRFSVYATISTVTAVASLVLGISYIFGIDSWIPALFG